MFVCVQPFVIPAVQLTSLKCVVEKAAFGQNVAEYVKYETCGWMGGWMGGWMDGWFDGWVV
jgi:hypothetical protein